MKMKAIVVHGPMDIHYEDVDVKKPGLGEVLIKIRAVGLCGTDADILNTELFYFKTGMAKLPIIPGHEWSGEIIELGEGVKDFSLGDHVSGECTVSCGFCKQCVSGKQNLCVNRTETGVMNRSGGYAEYITFPVSALHKFSKISFEEAAAIEPTCIAMEAVKRARVSPMDNVLIVGPGPIGLLAAQISKNVFAAKRTLISGTRDDRLNRAKNYTDGIINVKKENLKQRVAELTNGEGIDVVIEAAGVASSLTDCEGILNGAGRISMCGFFGAKQAPCNWDFIITNDIEIIGSLGSPGVWDFTIQCMERGKIDAKSIITHDLPVKSKDAFMDAFNIMEERRDGACKVIIRPS
jgi:2-desacetyl-2-hydroxyethyl bacteriochlorophyllide A dehydrogenase